MDVNRLLSIIAASSGFFGSILLARGILKLTPSIIAKQSTTYWGYNKSQLENITSQKADFVCGVFLIFVAFLIQITNLVFVFDTLRSVSCPWAVFWVVFALFSFLAIIFFLNKFLVKKYRIDTYKSLARQRLEQNLGKNKISHNAWESILKDAEHFCNIKRKDYESPIDFLKRYSDFLGVKIPDDIDLDELKADKQ